MPFITGLYIHGAGMNGHGRKEEGGNGALKNVACPLSMISLHVKRRVLHVQFNPNARFRTFYSTMDGQIKEGRNRPGGDMAQGTPNQLFPSSSSAPADCWLPNANTQQGVAGCPEMEEGEGGEFHGQ